MRVLYLCHRIPYPPNKGEKIRAFRQVEAFGARHEVDLFTLADDPKDLPFQDALAKHCNGLKVARIYPLLARARALPYLATKAPLTIPCFYSRELQKEIRQALLRRSYDRIFLYCSAMAQYLEPTTDIPVVADLVDVDSDKWMQYAAFTRFPFSAVYRREGLALRAYERDVCQTADCVVVSTPREAEILRGISPDARIHVVENGVDTAFFNPESFPRQTTRPTVIFTGDMGYFPNQDAVIFFARKVLPLVRRAVEGARFLIVGRNPGPNVVELKSIEGVEVTDFVPDVRSYLAQAHVAVAPFSIAAGIQNKILEALAYGLPVVATSRAAQALTSGVRDRVDIADSADEMANRVVLLLRDSNLARSRGMDGRRQVADDYRWERSVEQWLNLLEHPCGVADRTQTP